MNYKLCVYAIAKNESKFVDRWYESMKEADYICVLDTGSTDDTLEKLKSHNIITAQKHYKNFRFDIARNDSLKLIPEDADICICVDLDEVFVPGWAEKIKKNWTPTTTRCKYRYTWNFNSDGTEGVVFLLDKIHKNKMYKWIYPVHEILSALEPEEIISVPTIQLNHHADTTKSRSSYLPLLKLSNKENPFDDRIMHYLGREYMFYGQFTKAISTLKKHLKLPTATWHEERSASLRYIARCYNKLKHKKQAEKYYILAILEDKDVREPYYELAVFYYNNKEYLKCAIFLEEMLKIKTRSLTYISDPACWSYLPYDYLSLAYYELGDYKKAISNIEIAISLNTDLRLKQNRDFFYSLMHQTEN